jgi:hypothetical protein
LAETNEVLKQVLRDRPEWVGRRGWGRHPEARAGAQRVLNSMGPLAPWRAMLKQQMWIGNLRFQFWFPMIGASWCFWPQVSTVPSVPGFRPWVDRMYALQGSPRSASWKIWKYTLSESDRQFPDPIVIVPRQEPAFGAEADWNLGVEGRLPEESLNGPGTLFLVENWETSIKKHDSIPEKICIRWIAQDTRAWVNYGTYWHVKVNDRNSNDFKSWPMHFPKPRKRWPKRHQDTWRRTGRKLGHLGSTGELM